MSDNYIKMDGEKAEFNGGAVRYTKTGKGRFDLIPGDIIVDLITHAWENFYHDGTMTTSMSDIIQCAYQEDDVRYYETIINLINWEYTYGAHGVDDNGEDCKETTYHEFIRGLCKMLKDLAIHYENGAEKYGVDNWKKGIPVTGGDRGGSFTDSGLRHLNQYLSDCTDEHHCIACIWNFIGALWTLRNENNNETHSSDKSFVNDLNNLQDEFNKLQETCCGVAKMMNGFEDTIISMRKKYSKEENKND